MSEAENEVIVIDHPSSDPRSVHPHHKREVICKAGLDVLDIPPVLFHDRAERYYRTSAKDELGRAVFGPTPPEHKAFTGPLPELIPGE